MFSCPQLAVVMASGSADPQLIVRVEAGGPSGIPPELVDSLLTGGRVPMLCSLDPSGMHRNFGAWPITDQNSFVRKAADIAMQMANGSRRAS